MPFLQIWQHIWAVSQFQHSHLHIFGQILRHCLAPLSWKSCQKYENLFVGCMDFQFFECCSTSKYNSSKIHNLFWRCPFKLRAAALESLQDLVKIIVFSLDNQTYQNYEQRQQKLGTLLENKVFQKTKFSKIFFIKTWSPRSIFFTEKKIGKIRSIFNTEKLL